MYLTAAALKNLTAGFDEGKQFVANRYENIQYIHTRNKHKFTYPDIKSNYVLPSYFLFCVDLLVSWKHISGWPQHQGAHVKRRHHKSSDPVVG